MKKNLSKVIVPTLAIAIGAAVAGSISGTVAWYQYSTRVNAAYIGTSVGLSENLQISLRDAASGKSYYGWKGSLTHNDMELYLSDKALGQKVQPITSGAMTEDAALNKIGGTGADKNDPLFYKNPIRAYTATSPYSGWLKADKSMYVTIPLRLRYKQLDNEKVDDKDEAYLAKKVYLSDLLIQQDYRNSGHADPEDDRADLSDAIRVQIHSWRDDDTSEGYATSSINRLISKNGGTTQTNGQLDVDGVDGIDSIKTGVSGAEYGFGDQNDVEITPIKYGDGVQKSYSAKTTIDEGAAMYNSKGEEMASTEDIYPMVCASKENSALLDEDSMTYDKGTTSDFDKSIGETIEFEGTAEEQYLNVDITIWVEGWQVLDDVTTVAADDKAAMWSAADYIGSMFDVGFQFAVQAE